MASSSTDRPFMSDPSSSMARGTARQCSDLVLLHQFFAQGDLVHRRLVLHVEHLFTGADVALRIAVTVQAPLHIKRILAPHEGHLIDPPMTRRAADPFVDMNAVIEIDKAREIVHARPLERACCAKTFANGLQHGAIAPDPRMAVQANGS